MIASRQHSMAIGTLLVALLSGCSDSGAETSGLETASPTQAAPTADAFRAELGFHPVVAVPAPGPVPADPPGGFDPTGTTTLLDEVSLPITVGPAVLTNDEVEGARAENDSGSWFITVDFTSEGAGRWEGLTGAAACNAPGEPTRRIAIVLDGEVISSPQMDPSVECNVGIEGGSTQLSGDFTEQEAVDLAALLSAS